MPPKKKSKTIVTDWKPRSRQLIVLPDQGAPVKLPADFFGTKGREKGWNAQLDNFMRANSASLDMLEINLDFTTSQDDGIEVSLKANGIVGAIPLRAPDTHKVVGGVVVQPRFGWNSLGSLLSAIGWSAKPEILQVPLVPGSAREIPPWVIAGPALAHLELLLRHSGPKFRDRVEVRANPRGSVLWNRYCTEQLPAGNFHLLPCAFSDLDSDMQLRRYVRWALEKIGQDLSPTACSDLFARELLERVQSVVAALGSTVAQYPNQRALDSIERRLRQQTGRAMLGIEAIRWIVDERGLAGNLETDGLSWRMRMHELFEQWVESLVRVWAKDFGGVVSSGRKHESLAPISWSSRHRDTLSSLIPDVVVETTDEVFIFDAKYKGFLDEIDERRWVQSSEDVKGGHRHDLHQVLAYSSMYAGKRLTVVLVYPMTAEAWTDAWTVNRCLFRGRLDGPSRSINLALAGVSMASPSLASSASSELIESWRELRSS